MSVPLPRHWSRELQDGGHARVRLLACRPSTVRPDWMHRLFEVTPNPARAVDLTGFLRDRADVQHFSATRGGPGRWLVSVREPADPRCSATYRAEGYCLSCPLTSRVLDEDHAAWSLLFPDPAKAAREIARLPELAGDTKTPGTLLSLHPYSGVQLLTPRQQMAVATAIELGYFAVPRRAGIAQLATALGIRRSTALEHLHRGMERIFAQRLGVGDDRSQG